MSDTLGNPPEESQGGVKKLSTKVLQEKLRPYAAEAIEELVKIMRLPADEKNASNKIGAIKIILAKVLPDLKSSELTGAEGKELIMQFVVQTQQSKEQLEKLYEGSNARLNSGND